MEVGPADAGFVTYRAESLSRPIGTDRRRINWRYAFAVGSYHLIALLALLPWFFSWTGVALSPVAQPPQL